MQNKYRGNLVCLALGMLLSASGTQITNAQTPLFSKVVVFGDSLSDVGNIRNRTFNKSLGTVDYPSNTFNYANGRFTNDRTGTDPQSRLYNGVWHEELATQFLKITPATASLNGGLDFAFGGATTNDGTHEESVGGPVTITVTDMGNQVGEYLSRNIADPNALYAVWGGGNDLFNDDSQANVAGTVSRVQGLVTRLTNAGARYFIVPNVPPLGAVPKYASDVTTGNLKNVASLEYKRELKIALEATVQSFKNQGINITLYPLDVWLNFVKMAATPSRYGLVNVTDSAQGQSSVNPDQFVFWDDIHPTTAVHYRLAQEASRLTSGAILPTGKALNLSTRVAVGTGDGVGIGGFIIQGSVPKKVIIRAIGPSLGSMGVVNPLTDPVLELRGAGGGLITSNDDWRQSRQASAIQASGLAPASDLEAAIEGILPPGSYTSIITGKGGTQGVGLIEVYDLEPANASIQNISTRGFVGTGEEVMIAGVIVGSGENPVVVVRALGPSLGQIGITNPLLDPILQLRDANGGLIGINNDWKATQTSAIRATTLQPGDSREAAIVTTLAQGNYTAIVSGANGTTGVGLVEAYRIE